MRQPVLFVLVGGIQYVFDASAFGLMIGAGVATAYANVISRISAAALGFILNRYVTFSQKGKTPGRLSSSLGRFVLLWISLTLLSTYSLILLDAGADAGVTRSVLNKLGVEAVLAVISYFISKHWVYRR